MAKSRKSDARERIAKEIIAALSEGTVPWHRPWSVVGMPRSIHGKGYHGINSLILSVKQSLKGYTIPFWVTFNECKRRGGHVKRGEKSTPVVFYTLSTWEEENDKGEMETCFRRYMGYHCLFNVDQTEGMKEVPECQLTTHEVEPIETAETVLANIPNAPKLTHRGDSAHYIPLTDEIEIPEANRFETSAVYYATVFHEESHATGHSKRLDRKSFSKYGEDKYGEEELVAELASAFVCGEIGIDSSRTLKNSKSYIAGWAKRIKADTTLILKAATKASRAANYILNKDSETEAK